MTNTQLYMAIVIPSLFALLGIVTNITLYVFLAGRLDRSTDVLRTEMRADRAELIGKIDKLAERVHDDMQNIMGRDREMDKRVMKLEGDK
jgi:hypothetical protein